MFFSELHRTQGSPNSSVLRAEYPNARLCKELRMYLHRLRNVFCMLREHRWSWRSLHCGLNEFTKNGRFLTDK